MMPLILRFPLPAILAALVIDAADQAIFQNYTDPVSTSWGTALSENLWFVGLMVVVAIGVGVGIRMISRRTPPADWSFNMDVDKTIRRTKSAAVAARPPSVVSWYMFEKIALVSMVSIIFAQVLPGNDNNILGTVVAVSFIIVVNSFVGYWFARRGRRWATTFGEFIAMAVVNLASASYSLHLREIQTCR